MLCGELSLSHISGISLAENSVTVAWNNLTSLKSRPQVVSNGLVAEIVADSSFHLREPVKNLLVSKTMERSSKTIETCGEREHGGAESTANQVSSVSANIASLVIGVDCQVESHQFNKFLVIAKAKLVCEIVRIILVEL